MRKLLLLPLLGVLSASRPAITQDLAASIHTMAAAYASSGSLVALDKNTIVIEPKMPAPICAVPKAEGSETRWTYYSFALSSITVPLEYVDDSLIGEDEVFTDPDAAKRYKPGQAGDSTIVIIPGLPGKQFHTLAYDRDKFIHLGPGPHSSAEYGQAPDDTEAFALTFATRTEANAFAAALRAAVRQARAQVAQR
jgi:hypothetical protein